MLHEKELLRWKNAVSSLWVNTGLSKRNNKRANVYVPVYIVKNRVVILCTVSVLTYN